MIGFGFSLLSLSCHFVSSRGCGNGGKMFLIFPRFPQPGLGLAARHSVFVDDGEAVEGGLPVVDRHSPFFRDVPQGQVEQFEHRLIVWKRTAGFRHFTQRHVQRLDRVGRIDHPSNLRRMGEKRDHTGPV